MKQQQGLKLLFTQSGRPLKIEDIIRASGTESRTKTLELLGTIMKKTKSAFQGTRSSNTSRWIICISIKTRIQFNS